MVSILAKKPIDPLLVISYVQTYIIVGKILSRLLLLLYNITTTNCFCRIYFCNKVLFKDIRTGTCNLNSEFSVTELF